MMEEVLLTLISSINNNQGIGFSVYILINVILAMLVLPCSPLIFVAVIIWGPLIGGLISLLGTASSFVVTFSLSRKYGKKIVSLLPERYFNIVSHFLKNRFLSDWKSSFLILLNPLIPAASSGYFFGVTSINFSSYFIGAVIAIVPMTIVYAYFGNEIFLSIINNDLLSFAFSLVAFILVVFMYRKSIKFVKSSDD
jgi:uncharacterized membrane protein YdjX (TVP38/TMEM64 family)